MKVRIFIDFWNFQLNINDHTSIGYKLDWTKLSLIMTQQAASLIGQPLDFEET